MSTAELHDLCSLDDIANPGSCGFDVDTGAELPLRLFVVRKGDVLAAYRNRCPHTGAPLEWQPHQFLDIDNGFIQCAMHGALFRPEDGYCLRGPCVGRSLEPLEISLVGDRLLVKLPVAKPGPD
jgi:nitrite reductase/ring-hydroxylating ferredoxin subunit